MVETRRYDVFKGKVTANRSSEGLKGTADGAPACLTGQPSPLGCVLIKTNLFLKQALKVSVYGADGTPGGRQKN